MICCATEAKRKRVSVTLLLERVRSTRLEGCLASPAAHLAQQDQLCCLLLRQLRHRSSHPGVLLFGSCTGRCDTAWAIVLR